MDTNNSLTLDKQPQPKRKTDLNGLIITAIVVAVSSMLGRYGYDHYVGGGNTGRYEKSLVQTCEQINAQCPHLVDAETRLDNTSVLPGNRFQYTYTLIHFSAADIDTAFFVKNLEPEIKQKCRTSPDLQVFREHSTELDFVYYDNRGTYLFKIIVRPDNKS